MGSRIMPTPLDAPSFAAYQVREFQHQRIPFGLLGRSAYAFQLHRMRPKCVSLKSDASFRGRLAFGGWAKSGGDRRDTLSFGLGRRGIG